MGASVSASCPGPATAGTYALALTATVDGSTSCSSSTTRTAQAAVKVLPAPTVAVTPLQPRVQTCAGSSMVLEFAYQAAPAGANEALELAASVSASSPAASCSVARQGACTTQGAPRTYAASDILACV